MRIKSLIVTLVGVTIAGGSVFMAKEYLRDSNGAAIAAAPSDMVEVLVARTDIAFGQAIEAHLITTQSWPRDAVPSGAFLDADKVVARDGISPRRATGHLYQGEILLDAKLAGFGERVTIVQKLGENTRAMAVKVDAATAVGGFVTPGDYVDILLTQGRALDLRAVTVLQNIRVIGIDQQSEETNDQPEIARTITVEVTPDQGQRLALAQQAGTLSLTLRTLDGVVDEPLAQIELRDLFTGESPVEERERAPTITVRRGTTTEEVEVN